MASEEHVHEISELIARSSLGGDGISELCARTSADTVASILMWMATEEVLEDLDESSDLDEGQRVLGELALDRFALLWGSVPHTR